MNSPNVHRVGILGFGFIGKVHAYAYQTLPFFYDPVPLATRITHVVTSRRETAEQAQRVVGAAHGGTDHRDVTENPEVDIVHVCTPNHLHKDALVSALRHGKHVYCDKPLVAQWSEVEEVLLALQGHQGTTQMTFQNRFFPAILCARQLVEDGGLGEILGFRATYLHSGSVDPDAPLKWKLTARAGGGVIADLGSHVLDLVEHLAGPVESLTATTHIAHADRPTLTDPSTRVPVDAEDSVVMLARLPSGAVGTLEATKIATGSEDELRCEIEGSRGGLRFNLMDPHHLDYYDMSAHVNPSNPVRGWTRLNTGQRYELPATRFPSPKAPIGWIRAHVACLANFLQAVANRRPAAPDLRQGVRVQRLMEAAHRAAARQQWVDCTGH
ncbi:MAG: Gfo/Idh/MocA family protein [Planctomycetota bacterium]